MRPSTSTRPPPLLVALPSPAIALLLAGCGSLDLGGSGQIGDDDGGDDDGVDDDASDDDGSDDDEEPTPSPLDEEFEQALLQALGSALHEHDVPGIAIGVATPGNATWSAAAGLSDLADGTPLRARDRFKAGAALETFVVATLEQLGTEHEFFEIWNTPAAWVDEMPESWAMSTRQLLRHISGAPDYREHADFDPQEVWDRDDLLAMAFELPLAGSPGGGRAVTLTDYVLAGREIEAVASAAWQEEVEQRFLLPLGLDDCALPADGGGWGDVVRGYVGVEDVAGEDHPSAWDAAGGLVASAGDLATWAAALFGGEVLEPHELQDMVADPFHDGGRSYGLGMEIVDEYGPAPEYGQGGAVEGYVSWLGYRPDLDVGIAILANGWPAGRDEPEYAREIAQEIWTVVEQYVDPVGDDDDTIDSMPEATGQQHLHVIHRFAQIGTPARPEHDGVELSGYWDFDVAGETPGHFTVVSARWEQGEPVDPVECSFVANGKYDPVDDWWSTTGALDFDVWSAPDCPEWPGAQDWYELISGGVESLYLVPRGWADPNWVPTWPGAEEDLGGAATLLEYIDAWMAGDGADLGAVEADFVVLGWLPGLLPAEPQVTPWSFVGHFWQREGEQ